MNMNGSILMCNMTKESKRLGEYRYIRRIGVDYIEAPKKRPGPRQSPLFYQSEHYCMNIYTSPYLELVAKQHDT